jgi:hypothetical protein
MITRGMERAAALTWSTGAATFAASLLEAAASGTADQREVRQAVWRPRRTAQDRLQQAAERSGYPEPVGKPHADAVVRLGTLAARFLPPWAIVRLGRIYASSRRRFSRLRRAVAMR